MNIFATNKYKKQTINKHKTTSHQNNKNTKKTSKHCNSRLYPPHKTYLF